ncbi:MAG TPA: aminotransferase class V-fold PLP-dependent enzyme [Candidatus Limnocylindrales bacterium]|nr:aminotransferase class V-fold PLP-dependent enzyme [Candidatus Limnocylindrales bacterium]
MVSPFMTDAEKLSAVRAAIPSLGSGIHLNTGSVGPMPAEVAAAVEELQAYGRNLGRAAYDDYLALLDRMAEARAGVAAIVGGDLDEIALTHATTDGMNIATWGLDWRPGDRAVTTMHEHPGALGPLYAIRDRMGMNLVFADIGDGGDDDTTLEAFGRAIEPGTRLVALSHVLWSTGAVLPIARIAALARDRGALVAVDGAQAAGAIPVSVRDLGVDAYAIAAQKWLLGPEGMGALWVARESMDRIRPSFAGHFSFAASDSRGTGTWQPDARRYETAGYHPPAVVGMARAIGWLSMYVGLDFVHRRGAAQARRAADALAAIPGVELLTPRDRMANLVTFRIAGWEPQAALEELGARVFAIARTITILDALRISVGFWTSDDEIDRFVGGVRLLAEHSPETIPPRRTLPIFGEA